MIGLWLVFALLAVFGKTAYYTVQKRLLDDDTSSLELSYISSVYGFALMLPLGGYILLTDPPSVTWKVYAIVAGLGVIELVGLWMYLHALSLCDMSIASPMKKMKPTFVALLEPTLLGATVGPVLVAAAASTGIGGYIVLLKEKDPLAPFKRLAEPGPALALGTAVIYAILSLGSRFGNTALPTYVYGLIVYTVMTLGYLMVLKRKGEVPTLRQTTSRSYIVVGGLAVFRSVMVWFAYALATATLVSMVTQLTVLLDVLAGGALLKEGDTKKRIVGAAMILLGVVVALSV